MFPKIINRVDPNGVLDPNMECYERKVRKLFIVSLKNTGPMILHSLTAGSGPGEKFFSPPPLSKGGPA